MNEITFVFVMLFFLSYIWSCVKIIFKINSLASAFLLWKRGRRLVHHFMKQESAHCLERGLYWVLWGIQRCGLPCLPQGKVALFLPRKAKRGGKQIIIDKVPKDYWEPIMKYLFFLTLMVSSPLENRAKGEGKKGNFYGLIGVNLITWCPLTIKMLLLSLSPWSIRYCLCVCFRNWADF